MTPRTSGRSVPLTAFLCLVGALAGCDSALFQAFDPLHEEARKSSVPHQQGAALTVVAINGSIVASQSDREDVQIVARLRAVSPERLTAAQVIAERDDSGRLNVSVEWPDGKRRNREGCSFELLVPDAVDVSLRTKNGKVELAGLAGQAALHTSNGAVIVGGHDGPLSATTSNGMVKAEEVRGTIDVSTSNGRVEIRGADSRVDARTSNGAITIAQSPAGTGPITAQTSNGPVTLVLGPAMRGRMTLTTSNGSVQVDPDYEGQVVSQGKNRAELDFGAADEPSSASTSNGSIRVKRAADVTDAT